MTSPSPDFGRGGNYRVGAAEGAGTYGAREELFSDDEALAPTEHEKILVVSNGAEPSLGQWKADVEALLSLARAGETEKARERLKAIVSNRHYGCRRDWEPGGGGKREQRSRGEREQRSRGAGGVYSEQ